MAVIYLKTSGDFKNTEKFLKAMKEEKWRPIFEKYAEKGVEILANATPKDTGLTASMWRYEIHYSRGKTEIVWLNDNLGEGYFPIAIMLQYGHGTGNGGYVQGHDYINPAMESIFESMIADIWNEIQNI